MHAEAPLEEDAVIFRDGRGVAEKVLEDGGAAARRMHALGHLGELQRIAEENQVAGGRAHGQRVGERHLAGLVDHEVVERAVQLRAEKSHAVPAKSWTPAGAFANAELSASLRM